MSLKHAILGFLSFDAFSGYDLKKAFDRSIQHFWPANQSQIYRTLAQLYDEGLVTIDRIEREDRLDVKRYHITDEGREALHNWLSTPLRQQDYREPFLIQLYFGGKINDEEVLGLLRHEITEMEARLEIYRMAYQGYAAHLETHPERRAFWFSVTTLEYGMHTTQAALTWLRSVEQRLVDRDYSLEAL